MYQFLSYLSFYFQATNQHGVHSPFVYDYVTKCLYKKSDLRLPVSLKILVKSLDYFDCTTVGLFHEKTDTEEKIKNVCPDISFTLIKSDALYTAIENLEFEDIKPSQLQNDTVLVVNSIHRSALNFKKWEVLKGLPQVSVTLDLFYCGVVFFRKEQVSEHFKIRI